MIAAVSTGLVGLFLQPRDRYFRGPHVHSSWAFRFRVSGVRRDTGPETSLLRPYQADDDVYPRDGSNQVDRIMLFSQRYIRAIEQGQLNVELPTKVRKKFWMWLEEYDHSVIVRRDPNDNWTDNSTMLAEVENDLMRENGWDEIPDCPPSKCDNDTSALYRLVRDGMGHFVLDTVELVYKGMVGGNAEAFQQEINKVLDLHECPWRLADGEFFKLDGDFVGARLASIAHDALVANNFTGAADEYAKSRQELCSGEVKDAILHAGKSFESVLKVLTGLDHANANQLIQEMLSQGFLDDLPDNIRSGFAEQVMKTLPSLRNKLGGHGQGADVVDIPEIYGELAIQLAAAFHNFLIAKFLQRSGKSHQSDDVDTSLLDDDLPF